MRRDADGEILRVTCQYVEAAEISPARGLTAPPSATLDDHSYRDTVSNREHTISSVTLTVFIGPSHRSTFKYRCFMF